MPRRKMIPYDPQLKPLARELRNNSTLAEVLLWRQIKSRQVKGYKFLRQKPIDSYIVDFFCPDLMLALEVDGETHNHKVVSDELRQKRLASLGIKVVRILDIDVKRNLEGVLMLIGKCVEAREREISADSGGE